MKKRYHSDSSSEDDIPVKLLKKPMSSHLKELQKYSVHSCEFCDKVCYNKYSILVHNANHIVIPLLKYSICKCPTCDRYFPSQKELYIHKEIHHHKLSPSITSYLNEPLIIGKKIQTLDLTEDLDTGKLNGRNDLDKINYRNLSYGKVLDITEDTGKVNGKNDLKISNGKEKAIMDKTVVKCDVKLKTQRNGTEDVFNKANLIKDKRGNKMDIMLDTEIINCDTDSESSNSNDVSIIEEKFKNNLGKRNIKYSDSNITKDVKKNEDASLNGDKITDSVTINEKCIEKKMELIFEDDDLNDLINIEDNNKYSNLLMIGSKVNDEEFTPSVHYEELMEPGHFECSVCELDFTNRYDLILHKTKHINLKPPIKKPPLCTICDYYIAGNFKSLKQHKEKKHKDKVHNTHNTRICSKCNLKYRSIFQHYHNYHLLYTCPACFAKFEQETERDKHTSVCTGEKHIDQRMGVTRDIKVCEMCILFLKEKVSHKYVILGDFSRTGYRVTCERCEKKFFEVKLVRMTSKERMAMSKVSDRKPVSSNEERLKKMQRRLKMLNK